MADDKPTTEKADAVQTFTSDQAMHEAMRKQIADMLAQSDLSEEQKQEILVAMQCPCCGASGVSLSIRLKD
jgi:hypothetical protein